MVIRSIRHRGLLRLIEDDDGRELRSDLVRRLRNILAALIGAADIEGVAGPPGWRVHQLKGDRAGTWSISVSGNWRLTFDVRQGEIRNLDWRTTTDEPRTRQNRDGPAASGRVHPRGN